MKWKEIARKDFDNMNLKKDKDTVYLICDIQEKDFYFEEFAKWVASEIFDENWEYNKDAFAEIACRKLANLGIVRAKGDEWELVEPQESEKYCDRNICLKNEYNGIGCDECEVTKSQEPKTEWIPVSERLPEKDDLYLICFDNGEIDLVAFDRGAFSYSGVIAWMPLPEPYKAESEVQDADSN